MKRGLGAMNARIIKLTICLSICGFTAGCAGPGAGGGGMQLASVGGNCSSLRKELAGLDRRGVPSIIEAKNNGKRVSSSKQKLINRYNSVLNSYLSAKCHAKR